jgi:hypothetical protein
MTQSRKKQNPKEKNSSKKQSERFIQTAREVEADKSDKMLEKVFAKIVPAKPHKKVDK